jgi:DMSO/TMAO reductase YedYZ heme-binding membrane subunit
MVTQYWSYYIGEVYLFADIAVQIPGYVLLIAMTLTSFKPVRRKLSGRQWRVLHKGGIYFLWATVWSTYWNELYYYGDIQLIDYVFYWAGFLAWSTRPLAWSKKRGQTAVRPARTHPPVGPLHDRYVMESKALFGRAVIAEL